MSMTAQGMLFMSHTRPLVTRASDGTFQLTLLAFDRIGPHQVEPWRITWSGAKAGNFWTANSEKLKAGQPINVRVEKLRNFTNGARSGGPEFVVQAASIELAPAPVKRGDTPTGGVSVSSDHVPALGAPLSRAQQAGLEIVNRTCRDFGLAVPLKAISPALSDGVDIDAVHRSRDNVVYETPAPNHMCNGRRVHLPAYELCDRCGRE